MKKWKQLISLLLFCFVYVSVIQVYAEDTAPDAIQKRIEKADKLGLSEWIDDNGYLIDEFYDGKSDKELEELDAHDLIDSVTEEELDAYVNRLNMGIMAYTVTSYQKIQEGYDITGIFEVDGVLAYCVQHDVGTPAAGSPTSTPVETSNDSLRKVLYYGYNGPMDKGYSYVQTAMAASQANGVPAGNTGKRVLSEISAFPSPPSSFKVWIVHTNNGKTQDLAFYTEEKGGYAKVKKISSNSDMTDLNNCYSLKGAVYGVYVDEACQNLAVTLTTGENGESEEVELDQGTYYAKEIMPPKGYALNPEMKVVYVVAEKTTTFTMTDVPQSANIGILLEKVDSETEKNEPQGLASFENAQFQVKYYKGEFQEDEDPGVKGKTPDREWVFKTDKDGLVKLEDSYKVSGDALYLNSERKPALPLGTITIQEIKSPDGYHLNSQIFVRKIKGGGEKENIQISNVPKVLEDILQMKLLKKQSGTEIVVPNVEFEHTRPDESKEVLKTNADGELVLKGLQHGTHRIKETSVMDGYLLNGNILEFEVSEKNEITITSEVDMEQGNIKTEISEDGNIYVEVEDLTAPFSIYIHKKNDKDLKLPGAEFTLYLNEECTEEAAKGVTQEDGVLVMEGLKPGTKYYLKETKAPEGYRPLVDLLGNPVVFEIYVESVPAKDQFQLYVDGKQYDNGEESSEMFYVSGTKKDREVNITVINKIGFKLPDTGSMTMYPMITGGTILCLITVICSKKKKMYRRRK